MYIETVYIYTLENNACITHMYIETVYIYT